MVLIKIKVATFKNLQYVSLILKHSLPKMWTTKIFMLQCFGYVKTGSFAISFLILTWITINTFLIILFKSYLLTYNNKYNMYVSPKMEANLTTLKII